MRWFKKWWRKRKIRNGTLRWVRLQDADRNIKISRDRDSLLIKRKVIVFKDGKLRHDVIIRSVTNGGFSYDQEYLGVSPRRYRRVIEFMQRSFMATQVIVMKDVAWQFQQDLISEVRYIKETRYRSAHWELRSWELKGRSYVLTTNSSQDVNQLLMMAPSIGEGRLLKFGRRLIRKTEEDIMMFILTSSEELAAMS